MAVREQTAVASMLTWVVAGEVPSAGHAIKDGFLYEYGREVGTVMSVQSVASNIWHIRYLKAVRNARD